jgi:serralysin
MKSKFVTNHKDPFDSFFSTDGADAFPNFLAPPAIGSANPVASPQPATPVTVPTPTIPDEAVEAQAAQNGSGGPGSVVAETSGSGITINLEFDAAAMAAPASFRAGIEQAASILSSTITNKITVNLQIDYSGTGGGAAAGPDNGQFVNYSTVRADLIHDAAPGDTTFNALPAGSAIQGQSNVAVWNAQLKLFGLLGANDTTTDDGSATFATDINPNLLVGVALHELTHALGRVPYGSQPDIFDFYRFTSAGTRLFTDSIPASAAYFSVDGGNTKLADYGLYSDPSDFLNPGPTQLGGPYSNLTPNDAFNEIYGSSTFQTLTAVDLKQLDALGFNIAAPVTTVIESFGLTSLVQVGNNYFFYPVGGSSGPEFEYQGAPVAAGEYVWSYIGAEQTAGGYEVALHVAGTDQYTVWNTDSNGNFVSNGTGGVVVSGSSSVLESLEPSFHQDLNGDGVIGVPAVPSTVIESFGSTSLVQVGNNYFFYPVGGSSGPEFEYQGAPVAAGEYAWSYIGAEQTAGGYEVALHVAGTDQYTVWNTDSNGNFVSNGTGGVVVSGSSSVLESLEPSFHQDLNGDGVIGVPAATSPAPTTADTNSAATFAGSTLTLDTSSTSVGPIVGFAGDGTLQGSDQIDLRGTDYNSIHSAYDNSTGILAVSDGTKTTDIQFVGSYSQDNFKFAGDNSGGTIVYAQTGSSAMGSSAAGNNVFTAGQDTFVFAPNFGQVTIANFAPETDTIQISKTVFANIDALFAAIHDDSHGDVVITDAAHDTITIQNVSTAQLQAHQGDFHLV